MVLESLSRQGAIAQTHVWLDGTAARSELQADTGGCLDVARNFPVADLRAHRGHLGIEKLMLDALTDVARRHSRIVVLEDDCFPTRDAISTFNLTLDKFESRTDVFSVYGHHFLTPSEGETITRFQGWGWATTAAKLTPILSRARELFALSERDYLAFAASSLTPEVRARLDITPGRNVIHVLQSFFSWDSCTALLTAMAGQCHARTSRRVIYNCGLGGNSGHFPDSDLLRSPPFNMIRPTEVWDVY